MHQREKHLRCPTCKKRMLSVSSLVIHSDQMHNVTVTSVPNANQDRTSVDVDVLGMKGIPEEYYLAFEGRGKDKAARAQQGPHDPNFGAVAAVHNAHIPAHPYDAHAAQHQQPYAAYPPGYQSAQHYPQQTAPFPAQRGYPQYPAYASDAYASQQAAHSYPYASYPPAAQMQQPYNAGYNPYGAPVPNAHHATYAQQGYHSYNNYTQYPNGAAQHHRYPQSQYPNTQQQANALQPSQGSQSPLKGSADRSKEAKEAKSVEASRVTPPVADSVKLVFDKHEVSMEELRAQLPRYQFK